MSDTYRVHPAPSHMAPLRFDIDEYRGDLASFEMTDDEERLYLEALWEMVVGCADIGFGIHPAQFVAAETLLAQDSIDVVDSPLIQESNDKGPMEKSVEEMDS